MFEFPRAFPELFVLEGRVVCRVQPVGEEFATGLELGELAQLLALVEEAALVAAAAFAEVAAVLGAHGADAELVAAAVERAHAAARNHDVELSLLHVAADVGHHHDHLLAVEAVAATLVVAAVEGEEVAVAALGTVGRGDCRKAEGYVVVGCPRGLEVADAGFAATVANTLVTVTDDFHLLVAGPGGADGFAGVVLADVAVPSAVGLAAVPVTGSPAVALVAAAQHLELGRGGAAARALDAGARLDAARALDAGAGLGTAGALHAAGRLGVGAGGRDHAGAGFLQGECSAGKLDNRGRRRNNHVAVLVVDASVGMDRGTVRIERDGLAEVNGSDGHELVVQYGAVRGIENTDVGAFEVVDREHFGVRHDDVCLFTMADHPPGGHFGLGAADRSFFGRLGFSTAVPGESNDCRDGHGSQERKFHFYLDILFLSLIKRFLISHTENPN